MSRASKQDELVARIDADLAQIGRVANYVGGDGSETLSRRVTADLERLQAMRDYITSNGAAADPVEKPKRTRKRKGLPAATANNEQES